MNIEDARAIFRKNRYSRQLMKENGVLEQYKSYNVPREKEAEWVREDIDEMLKEMKKYDSLEDEEFARMFYKIGPLTQYITNNQIIELYNLVTSKATDDQIQTESTYYHTLYRIMYKSMPRNEMFLNILKHISERCKKFLEASKNNEEYLQEYEFYSSEFEKYSRK